MRRRPERSGERGSVTVYVLSLVLLLTVLAVGTAGFAGLAVAKHRATTAADLAALAAASAPVSTSASGCDLAVDTAARNGGRVTDCVREGSDVTVTVVVVARSPFGMRPAVHARARAGPAR